MTSKLTREERVQALYDLKVGQVLSLADIENVKMLARMALAAMDSEPDCNERQLFCSIDTSRMRKVTSVSAGSEATPLHRHAQPAPVVPDAMEPTIEAIKRILPTSNPDEYAACIGADMWNACRAAMLQEPQKSAGVSNNCRSNENVQVMHTKSPAQSDCCPVQNQGWIPVSERMPDDEQEVLTINKMGHRFVSFFDKHSGLFFDRLDAPAACCIEHVLVTHWMPLPAAPQEVTNGK